METRVTAFLDDRVVSRGTSTEVLRAIEERYPDTQGELRVFEDGSGRIVDLDLWDASAQERPSRPRGRPKLGVVAREVTLLPRHWDWLARQPGGASAALRRLVEAARKDIADRGETHRRDAVYRFLTMMAGDRAGYEESLRALYRGDQDRFFALIRPWPDDVRSFAVGLLLGDPAEPASA